MHLFSRAHSRTTGLLVAVSLTASGLSSCAVPEVGAAIGNFNKRDLFAAVIRGVQCEIRNGIKKQINEDSRLRWLLKWSAIINLKLTVKDSVGFGPGVSLNTPMIGAETFFAGGTSFATGQSYALGLGGKFEGSSTRAENVEFYYDFADFDKYAYEAPSTCYRYGSITITGDLDLTSWLEDVLEPVRQCAFEGQPPLQESDLSREEVAKIRRESCESLKNPISTVSHSVDFEVALEGNVTPVWNLIRVSTTSSPLFGASRRGTSELLLTLGPSRERPADYATSAALGRKGRSRPLVAAGPSESMVFRNLSLQIGSTIRDVVR